MAGNPAPMPRRVVSRRSGARPPFMLLSCVRSKFLSRDGDEVKLGGAVLGAHGNYFDMEAEYARMKDGSPSPFIDPDSYNKYVTEREQAFRKELAKQKASGPSH